VNSQTVKDHIPILEPRFLNASTLKGTRKNHQFIPRADDITMNRISGEDYATLLVQASENIPQPMSIENILPRSFYACRYEHEWYRNPKVSVEKSRCTRKTL